MRRARGAIEQVELEPAPWFRVFPRKVVGRPAPHPGPRPGRPSRGQDVGVQIVALLREQPAGLSKAALAQACGVSHPTIQRALSWLRNEHDAPLHCVNRRWVLMDPTFALPLLAPEGADVSVMLLAAALLSSFGDRSMQERLDRLVEQMDARCRHRSVETGTPAGGCVSASMTFGTHLDPSRLSMLLGACGRGVLQIEYRSIWSGQRRTFALEPWQLRVHDGALYLRGFSRLHQEARTFRVADIVHVGVVEGERPRARMPARGAVWGQADPQTGIDEDRPGVAWLRVRGAVARWIAPMVWHPAQRDHWVEPGECLERRVPYRSCREFGRRLLQIADGLEGVEPAELRGQIEAYATRALQGIAG